MRIYFQKVEKIEQLTQYSKLGAWHVMHGWAYNVWDCSNDGNSGRVIGMFYVTLLPGAGGVLHFDTVVQNIPGSHILAAFRKSLIMMTTQLDIILATVPVHKLKLIAVLKKLGFHKIGGGEEYILLQYFKKENYILNKEQEISGISGLKQRR